MIRKTGKRLKRLVNGSQILRRQVQKRGIILNKYREESLKTTLLKSGDSIKNLTVRSSEFKRALKRVKLTLSENIFERFLTRAREILYDPNSETMQRVRIRLEYNLALRTVEEQI